MTTQPIYGIARDVAELRACDPGNTTGMAYFSNGKLAVAFATPFTKLHSVVTTDETVVEVPDRVKTDPKSILSLALKAGRLIERYNGIAVPAGLWKGTVPKLMMCRRILAHLSKEELERLPRNKSALGYDHNMVDAVGLGLFALGRMARGGRMR